MNRFPRKHWWLVIAAVLALGCARMASTDRGADSTLPSGAYVRLPESLSWGPLNPARGDASPRAANLWGDRSRGGATGFLVRFVEGFSSPPHIHNVSYRGLVLRGSVHNDDPGAADLWLPPGSYWTQPAGEVHITAARDAENLVYVEIEDGPYLVHPLERAFDNGERPINVHTRNLVWQSAGATPGERTSAEVALLWGTPQQGQMSGRLLRWPAGLLTLTARDLDAVVLRGELSVPGTPAPLTDGAAFGASEQASWSVRCEGGSPCVLYLRARGSPSINL